MIKADNWLETQPQGLVLISWQLTIQTRSILYLPSLLHLYILYFLFILQHQEHWVVFENETSRNVLI